MNDADAPIATEVLASENPALFIRLSAIEKRDSFQRGYKAAEGSNEWLYTQVSDNIRQTAERMNAGTIELEYGDLNRLLSQSMELINLAENLGNRSWLAHAYITRKVLIRNIRESDFRCDGFYDALDYRIYTEWRAYATKYDNPAFDQPFRLPISAHQWESITPDLSVSADLYLAASQANTNLFDPSFYANVEVCGDYAESGDCWFCCE
jgi:hypothetical protein